MSMCVAPLQGKIDNDIEAEFVVYPSPFQEH